MFITAKGLTGAADDHRRSARRDFEGSSRDRSRKPMMITATRTKGDVKHGMPADREPAESMWREYMRIELIREVPNPSLRF